MSCWEIMFRFSRILQFVIVAAICGMPSPVVAAIIDWVTVGDPGNVPYEHGFGGVDYAYRIGQFEITKGQYAEFLNAVAQADPNGIYHPGMGELLLRGGILRAGDEGAYLYHAAPGRENQPVAWASFWNAIRFANWLHNGQPVGPQGPETTEDGAYTITPEGIATNTITRNPNARVFIPSTDEWIKAAYYKGGGTDAGYWQWPFRSDEEPIKDIPPGGPNSANYGSSVGGLTNVGSFPDSFGPYGTYDQGGNVWEWTDTMTPNADGDAVHRGLYGGSWFLNGENALSVDLIHGAPPSRDFSVRGFRVASIVPEPASVSMTIIALTALLHACRRVSRRRC